MMSAVIQSMKWSRQLIVYIAFKLWYVSVITSFVRLYARVFYTLHGMTFKIQHACWNWAFLYAVLHEYHVKSY